MNGSGTGSFGGGSSIGSGGRGGTATISRGSSMSSARGFSSPERGGGASSKFSSKGLASFRGLPITPKSSVDINHGRGEHSPFARTQSLIPKQKMGLVDIGKYAAKPRVAEANKNSIRYVTPDKRSIQQIRPGDRVFHGNPFKDTAVLWKNPNMPKVEKNSSPKPKSEVKTEAKMPVSPHRSEQAFHPKAKAEQRSEAKVVQPIRRELPFYAPRPKAEARVETKQVQFIQKDAISGVKTEQKKPLTVEVKPRVQVLPRQNVSPKRENLVWQSPARRISRPRILPKPEVRVVPAHKEQVQARTRTLYEFVRLNQNIKPEVARSVRADIEYATKVLPKLVEAQQMPEAKVQTMLLRVLREKYKTNPQVEVALLPAVETEEEAKTEVKAKPKAEKKQRTLHELRVQIEEEIEYMRITYRSVKVEEKVLYFQKDTLTNKKRIKAVMQAAEAALRSWREGQRVSGKDIADKFEEHGRKESFISEISQVIGKDRTLDDFKDAIGKLGEITHLHDLQKVVAQIAHKFTAVKLSLFKRVGDDAKGSDAEKVYGQALNGVSAYVAEDLSTGFLIAGSDADNVVYLDSLQSFSVDLSMPQVV